MRKRKHLNVLAGLFFILLFADCLTCTGYIKFIFREEKHEPAACDPLPADFSAADLVGTWAAKRYTEPQAFDTLILRDDGMYKQIIHLESPTVEYETDWQSWWFEYRESGIGYLHMQGLRTCANGRTESCDWVSDGKIPWADYCERRWITPPAGEIVLLVRPANMGVTYRFSLEMTNGFENSAWSYIYQEP